MALNVSNLIHDQISLNGTSISLIPVSGQSYDDYGDESYTKGTTCTVTAVINDISGDESWNRDGIFDPGDKVFFMAYNEVLTEDNKDSYYIYYNSDSYKIMQVLQPKMGTVVQVKEARCKRK